MTGFLGCGIGVFRGRIVTAADVIRDLLGDSAVAANWCLWRGVTLGSTLKRIGTGTGVVTISGGTSAQTAPTVEITPDSTHFRYSADNGTTWIESGVPFTAGSTNYQAQGDLGGLTFSFGAGSYVTADQHVPTIAQIDDQGPNGYHLTQPDPVKQFRFILRDALHNNRPSALSDGVDDDMVATAMPMVAPGTTNRQIRFIGRVVTWAVNRALWGGGTNGYMQLFANSSSPNYALYNGGSSIAGTIAAGAFKRIRVSLHNSTADRLLIGATSTGGAASAGNLAASPSEFHVGSNGTAGSQLAMAFSEMTMTTIAGGAAGVESALQAYETPMYGSALYS